MKKTFNCLIFLIFLKSYISIGQVDTTITKNLKEVIVIGKKEIKLKPKKGFYEVNVQGTIFEEQQNAWEGLKTIPLLRVNDQEPVKINGKSTTLFINGIESNFSSSQLEDFLKSIDANTVEKIEITTNPNASYEASVETVLNIVLNKKNENYKIGINTTNGIKTKYYNFFNTNYTVSNKKTFFYSNYSFNFLPKVNFSEIRREINDEILNINNIENEQEQKHSWFSNLNYIISKKSVIDFTYSFSTNNDNYEGNSFNENFNRTIISNKSIFNHKLSQVYKNDFSDNFSMDIGSYQVLTFNSNKSNAIQDANNQNQDIKSNINLFIGFANFKYNNKFGYTSFGVRYNNTTVKKENFENLNSFPFELKENITSFYLNHSLSISKTSSLNLGIRSETSNVYYNYYITNNEQQFSNSTNYTNLLYNISYDWQNEEKKVYQSISFRKTISRPNYNYLNPFQLINRDITTFEGDFNIVPSQLYLLSYEKSKNNWNYYINTGINFDFISSFYDNRNNNIVSTYQNFDQVMFLSSGLDYTKYFFRQKWKTNSSISTSIFKIKENEYDIGKSTPDISFNSSNFIDLGKDYKLNINYFNNLSYRDGTILHYNTQRLDIGLTKKINQQLILRFFINDLFKTSISGLETTLPNYLYKNIAYNDVRAFGLNIRYDLSGKKFESKTFEEPSGNEIDRLK